MTQSPNQAMARQLVEQHHQHHGLIPLDIERFWADQQEAIQDPFGPTIAQVPLGLFGMAPECVFAELDIEEDYWRLEQDVAWRNELFDAYNRRAQRIIGRPVFTISRPGPKADLCRCWFEGLFGAEKSWHDRSWWLQQVAGNPDELCRLLDTVEHRLEHLRSFVFGDDWDDRKQQVLKESGPLPLYRHQRGPVTFATSIFGAENLIYLILENPDLAARLRDVLSRAMVGFGQLLDSEAAANGQPISHCFHFYDDNCYLLTPEMYEFFALPILHNVFAAFAPQKNDWRYQHSDSAMHHLLPLLATCHFSQVNFGPTLTVEEIRAAMPDTIIEGQLAPFALSNDQEVAVVEEFLRDFEMARKRRGLLFATAGSINNGSRLRTLRLIMAAVQRHGRY